MKKVIWLLALMMALFACKDDRLENTAGPPAIPPAWKPYDGTTIQPATSTRPNVKIPGTLAVGEPSAAADAEEVETESYQWENDAAQDTPGYRQSYVVVQNADGNESTVPMTYQMVSGTERGAGRITFSVSLADGAQVLLPVGITGHGTVSCPGGSAYASFFFTSAGVITLVDDVLADTAENNDTTLNVFDDGSGIGIENELGSTLTIIVDITAILP